MLALTGAAAELSGLRPGDPCLVWSTEHPCGPDCPGRREGPRRRSARAYAGLSLRCEPLLPEGSLVRLDATTDRPREGAPELSPREFAVLRLLADGHSGVVAASMLAIKVATVRTHTTNLKRKLGSATLAGAVARAQDLGLVRRSR